MQVLHDERNLDAIVLPTLNKGLQRRRELSSKLDSGILELKVLEQDGHEDLVLEES